MATKAKSERKVLTAESFGRRPIHGRYDLAQTTDENKNMWSSVDALSAAAANSPGVRKITRQRARYEVANNSYGDGMMDTLASDMIGDEIQLQLGDAEPNQIIEADFSAWARETRLFSKLRTMTRARFVDGEAFAMIGTNRALRNLVKLDIRPFECDMVESWGASTRDDEIDGIRFDEWQNPVAYRVLNQHPGDHRISLKSLAGEWINAKYIIHYFSAKRPGQVRGVTELLPALGLFGELRLFTSAVISCATRAAEITAVMQTTMCPDDAVPTVDPGAVLKAERNGITSLPEGWVMNQLKAEQPSTTYKMFKREILNEMARCISMPQNIALCDSSDYNYASGRLDHQTYERSIQTERSDIRDMILDRVYAAWLDEYAIAKRMTATEKAAAERHEWYYRGRGHVDPNKEANADNTRFGNLSNNLSIYYSGQGKDWKRPVTQAIVEKVFCEKTWNEERKKQGLPPAPFPVNVTGTTPDEPDEPPSPNKAKEE